MVVVDVGCDIKRILVVYVETLPCLALKYKGMELANGELYDYVPLMHLPFVWKVDPELGHVSPPPPISC